MLSTEPASSSMATLDGAVPFATDRSAASGCRQQAAQADGGQRKADCEKSRL